MSLIISLRFFGILNLFEGKERKLGGSSPTIEKYFDFSFSIFPAALILSDLAFYEPLAFEELVSKAKSASA